ncbi:ephrin-B2 [Aplysia californica]|uniref:Ephrin-B2 n=1 Tax=Aplysia californica TaxID=6500 RepID=A0ABM1A0X7_APLCA|nr:ephrin-B2 [Aplysia californica]
MEGFSLSSVCAMVCTLSVCTLLSIGLADGRNYDVFWNSTANTFDRNNDDHIIEVNLHDRVQIICPHYSDGSVPSSQWEYYLIYKVDKVDYDNCVIDAPREKQLIGNCSRPEKRWAVTLPIFELQSVPGIPDFVLGEDYYFISTSGGRRFNMNNQFEGACKTHNMKMIIQVRRKSTDTDKPTGNGGDSNPGGEATTRRTTGWNPDTRTDNPVPTQRPVTTPRPVRPSRDPPRTTTNTVPSTRSTTPRRPSVDPTDPDKDGDPVPGSDGFPDDNTVIRDGDGPNINSGVIADNGDGANANSALSLHSHYLPCLLTAVVSLSLLLRLVTGR